jgi:hypothetical protein
MFKKPIFLLLIMLSSGYINAQVNPVKRFSLKKETTEIPSDSLGTTYLYSLSFEVNDNLVLTAANFKLKSLTTDSLINQQTFNLPLIDGVYQTGFSPNGLIKDHNSFFILLGNVKSIEPLMLISDFIDSKSIHYNDILTNE